jgi:TRAP-type C4-dicarboxylate transport system substrate-binding protein
MNIRRVLTGLSGMLVAALMTTTANSQEFQLRFADQVPLTHVASAAGNQVFMERVQEALGDRVAFRHYPAEQLGRAASMLDIVQNRTADIAMVGVTYASDRLPLVGAIELPGLFDNVVDGQAAFDALVRNELMESFEGAGLRPLWVMTTPPYQLMMRQAEPIESAEDLAGKQLRVAGATSQLVAASLGASPATIPPADLYQSLERGVVDGALYTLAAMRAGAGYDTIFFATPDTDAAARLMATWNETTTEKVGSEP